MIARADFPAQLLARATSVGWDRWALGLFALVLILILATFTDYGVTWDADAEAVYGQRVLDYYVSGFADLRYLSIYDLFYYGAAYELPVSALNVLSPLGVFETRHLSDALMGLAGIVGTWKLGRALAGPRAGFIAALFIALTPNYYGQMFNNPKDIPFAAGIVWALYYLIRILPELPRPNWRTVAKLGLVSGLAMGIRVGGFLIFGYAGLLLLLVAFWRGVETRRAAPAVGLLWVATWRWFVPAFAIAYLVMIATWPWAQAAPLTRPFQALFYFSHEIFPWRTLFAGEYLPAADLPWTYLPVYIALALPELVLVVLALAPLVLVSRWRQRDRDRVLGLFIIGFAIAFPVAYAVAIKAVLFDGMRHFIFVLPPIAAFAAVIADRLLDRLSQLSLRRFAYAGIALYGIAHVGTMAMLHPDEYVYYNGFIGGVSGASGLFKLDYWANSYAEAAAALESHLRAEYGADFMNQDFTIAVCGPQTSAAYYLPSNFIVVPNREDAQFFIAFTKDNCNKSVPGKEIYRVERMGTLLSVVLDRRPILAEAERSNRASVRP